MKMLVEKEFYVHERHTVRYDDHPVQGASQKVVRRSVTHGPLKTKEEVKAKINGLIGQYATIRRVRTDNWIFGADEVKNVDMIGYKFSLFKKTAHSVEGPRVESDVDEISFEIEEKVLSEELVK